MTDMRSSSKSQSAAMRLFNRYVRLMIGMPIAMTILYYSLPRGAKKYLVGEDMIVEWATAIVFVGAFIFSVWKLIQARRPPGRNLLVPVLAFLAAGDELSWGERLFSLEMPILYEFKIDGLHDALTLLHALAQEDRGHGLLAGLVIFGLAVFAAAVYCFDLTPWRLLRDWKERSPYSYILIGAGLMIISTVLDLEIRLLQRRYLKLLEETCELLVAAGMLFAAIAMELKQPEQEGKASEA